MTESNILKCMTLNEGRLSWDGGHEQSFILGPKLLPSGQPGSWLVGPASCWSWRDRGRWGALGLSHLPAQTLSIA